MAGASGGRPASGPDLRLGVGRARCGGGGEVGSRRERKRDRVAEPSTSRNRPGRRIQGPPGVGSRRRGRGVRAGLPGPRAHLGGRRGGGVADRAGAGPAPPGRTGSDGGCPSAAAIGGGRTDRDPPVGGDRLDGRGSGRPAARGTAGIAGDPRRPGRLQPADPGDRRRPGPGSPRRPAGGGRAPREPRPEPHVAGRRRTSGSREGPAVVSLRLRRPGRGRERDHAGPGAGLRGRRPGGDGHRRPRGSGGVGERRREPAVQDHRKLAAGGSRSRPARGER